MKLRSELSSAEMELIHAAAPAFAFEAEKTPYSDNQEDYEDDF